MEAATIFVFISWVALLLVRVFFEKIMESLAGNFVRGLFGDDRSRRPPQQDFPLPSAFPKTLAENIKPANEIYEPFNQGGFDIECQFPPEQPLLPASFPEHIRYFTGRERVLNEIDKLFEDTNTAVACGLSDVNGAGKTSVAVEYAYTRKDRYKNVLYINASENELDLGETNAHPDRSQHNGTRRNLSHVELHRSMAEVLRDINAKLPIEATQDMILNRFRQYLQNSKDWLLIVDNVDDVEFVLKCGFQRSNGKIIYTTNNDEIFKFSDEVKLGSMSADNAILLLHKHWRQKPKAEFDDIPEADRPILYDIAKDYEHHPFSMECVGSYLSDQKESPKAFFDNRHERNKHLVNKYQFLTSYRHSNLAKAFLLRYEQITTPQSNLGFEPFLSQGIKDYLKLAAFLAPVNIPADLLRDCLIDLHPDFDEEIRNEQFILEVYQRFGQKNILRYSNDDRTLTTHRTIQEIMRHQIDEIEEQKLLTAIAAQLARSFETFDYNNEPKIGPLVPHVSSFLSYLGVNK